MCENVSWGTFHSVQQIYNDDAFDVGGNGYFAETNVCSERDLDWRSARYYAGSESKPIYSGQVLRKGLQSFAVAWVWSRQEDGGYARTVSGHWSSVLSVKFGEIRALIFGLCVHVSLM